MKTAGFQDVMTGCLRLVIFALLAYSGMLKLNDPGPSAAFAGGVLGPAALGLHLRPLATGLGVTEICLGVLMVVVPSWRLPPLFVGSLFSAFSAMHAVAWWAGSSAPCSCLGKHILSSFPHWVWVALTLVYAGACAWLSSRPRDERRDDPSPLLTAIPSQGAMGTTP